MPLVDECQTNTHSQNVLIGKKTQSVKSTNDPMSEYNRNMRGNRHK